MSDEEDRIKRRRKRVQQNTDQTARKQHTDQTARKRRPAPNTSSQEKLSEYPKRRPKKKIQGKPTINTTRSEEVLSEPKRTKKARRTNGNNKAHLTKRKRQLKEKRTLTSCEEENYQGDGESVGTFQVDRDDIFVEDKLSTVVNMNVIAPPTLPSQPKDFLYIERKDGQGFVKEPKRKHEQKQKNFVVQLDTDFKEDTLLDFVLKLHIGFRNFALLLHGLLAGVAVCQCIFVFMFANDTIFLQTYFPLALPFHSLYYFLLTCCCLSVLDRYANINNGLRNFLLHLLSKPSRALAIVVYILAFILSVSLTQLEDRIEFYGDDVRQPILWESTDHLYTWKVVTVMRVVCVVLGWLVVGLNPIVDHTQVSIEESIKKETKDTPLPWSSVNAPI